MVKLLLWLSLISGIAFSQPIISSVRADSMDAPNGDSAHGDFRLRWNLDRLACFHKVSYTRTGLNDNNSMEVDGCGINDVGFPLSGLLAGTTYNYTVMSSVDKITWGSASGVYITAGLPTVHPAPPQLATSYKPPFPNTTNYASVNISLDCHELPAAEVNSVNLQPINGTVIKIPHKAIASGACGALQFPDDTQLLTIPIDSFHVSVVTGFFTPSNTVSGWVPTVGQGIRLAGGCLPGSYTQGNNDNSYNPRYGSGAASCGMNGQFMHNYTYYIVGVLNGAFQLGTVLNGIPIVPADVLEGGIIYAQQWQPQNSNWIVIETDTPSGQFCVFGATCDGPTWQSKMALVANQGGCFNCNVTGGYLNHHIWILGIEVTTTDTTPLYQASMDPEPSNWLINFPYNKGSNYIVFDRCYIHGQPFPNRYTGAIVIGGSYIAFLNTDIEKFDYYHMTALPQLLGQQAQNIPNQEGLSGSVNGQTLTIIPGSFVFPNNSCTATQPITFSVNGTGTGQTLVYGDNQCTPTMQLPLNSIGTCTGSFIDINGNNHPCAILPPVASPSWPIAGGGINVFTLGTMVLSNGVIVTNGNCGGLYCGLQNAGLSQWDTEGSQVVQTAQGPGPFSIIGNIFKICGGLIWHFSDDSIVDPINVLFERNNFLFDQACKIGSTLSDLYEHYFRNGPEMKHGRQAWFHANKFLGCWNSVSLTGPCLLMHTADYQSPQGKNFTTQDVLISFNKFDKVSTAIEVGGGVLTVPGAQFAAARIEISNNLLNSNGWIQTDANSGESGNGGGLGNLVEIDNAVTDFAYKHNSAWDTRGQAPVLWHAQVSPIEGCQVTDNINWFSQSAAGITSETGGGIYVPMPSGTGSILFNSMCPNGIIAGNIAVPGYANSQIPSGIIDAQAICSSFGGGTLNGMQCPGGLITTVLNGGSVAANEALLGFPNLLPTSDLNQLLLHNAAAIWQQYTTDGTDIGINRLNFLIAQGTVTTPVVIKQGNTFVITWYNYDSSAICPVDYATDPNIPASQIGGARLIPVQTGNFQSVSINTTTTINYQLMCPVDQPIGQIVVN